jgi:DNA-binding transcriptional LysR family regulator
LFLAVVETSQREVILPLVLAGAGAAVMPEAIAVLAAAQGAVTVPFDPLEQRSGLLALAGTGDMLNAREDLQIAGEKRRLLTTP